MTPMKRQPTSLMTGSLVFMVLAVILAVLSGDLLLVLAVSSAIGGVMVLSRPSRKPVHVRVAAPRYEVSESRRAVSSERAMMYGSNRTAARSIGVARARSRRASGTLTRPYTVVSDSSLPVIQVLR